MKYNKIDKKIKTCVSFPQETIDFLRNKSSGKDISVSELISDIIFNHNGYNKDIISIIEEKIEKNKLLRNFEMKNSERFINKFKRYTLKILNKYDAKISKLEEEIRILKNTELENEI